MLRPRGSWLFLLPNKHTNKNNLPLKKKKNKADDSSIKCFYRKEED